MLSKAIRTCKIQWNECCKNLQHLHTDTVFCKKTGRAYANYFHMWHNRSYHHVMRRSWCCKRLQVRASFFATFFILFLILRVQTKSYPDRQELDGHREIIGRWTVRSTVTVIQISSQFTHWENTPMCNSLFLHEATNNWHILAKYQQYYITLH